MKKYIFISILILITSSFKQETIDCSISNIKGKISNWNLGIDYKIILCQQDYQTFKYKNLDSSEVDIAGNFNITLKTIPKLKPIYFGTLARISDMSAKISGLWLKVFSKEGKLVGNVIYGKYKDAGSDEWYGGDVGVRYYYVDKDVQIYDSTAVFITRLKLKAGWNKYITRVISSKQSEMTVDFSRDKFKDAEWIFFK